MRKNHLSIFFFLSVIIGYSQKNNSIIGEWKVITVESENFYLKTTNNPISLSKKYTENHTNQAEVQNYTEKIKLAYLNNIFFFDKYGNFNQTSDLAVFKSKYKINYAKSLIEVKDTGLKGENISFEMPFKIEKNILFIRLIESSTKFVLIRVENQMASENVNK